MWVRFGEMGSFWSFILREVDFVGEFGVGKCWERERVLVWGV